MYTAVGAFRHLEDSSFPFAEYRAYHENEQPYQNKNLPAASKI
jgi:hypothetical protein